MYSVLSQFLIENALLVLMIHLLFISMPEALGVRASHLPSSLLSRSFF